MKKVLFILAFLAIGMIATAQTQTIYSQLKLNTVNDGTASDSLVLVQGTDKIVRKIPLSSISSSTEIPSLQQVTNNGNTTSHPIHAKEFRVDNVADSLAVLNNRFLSFGDIGNDYNGNWNKYMSVFDPQDYPEGFEIYNEIVDINAGFNLHGNAEEGNIIISMALWDRPSGGDQYYSYQVNSPNYIDSQVHINGTPSFGSATRLVPESFSVYHNEIPEYASIFANKDFDVTLGDKAGYLGAASNRILIQNSANKIRVVAPDRLELGSAEGNARVNIFNDETTEIVGSNIWLKSHPTAAKAQLNAGGLTDDRAFIFPDATGTLATQEWVTANSGGGTPTLQEVLTAGNTSTDKTMTMNTTNTGSRVFKIVNTSSGMSSEQGSGFHNFYNGAENLIQQEARYGEVNITLNSSNSDDFIVLDGFRKYAKVSNGGWSKAETSTRLEFSGVVFNNNGYNGTLKPVTTMSAAGDWLLPKAYGTMGVVNTTAPASATATGVVGEIRVTSTYIYVCIADNTWVRAPLATW